MLIKTKWLFLLLFVFSVYECDFFSVDSDIKEKDGMYYIISTDGQYLIPRHFTKTYTGTYCTVWQDDYISMTASTAQVIAGEFDATIFTNVTSNFADPYDVDGDGKVAIFVYSGDDGSGGSYIAGYFYPGDMYAGVSGSNKMDVIYLNGVPSNHLPASVNFYGTIAHEFQHMCNFSWNVIEERNGDSSYQMVTWADEGMAEVSSALCYGFSSNQDRVQYFENDSSGDFSNGNVSLILWASDIDNYALVYSFMAFLYDKNSSVFHYFYEYGHYNNTSEINSALIANSLSGLNTQYKAFLSALYLGVSASSEFPAGFFPSGFTFVKSGSADAAIKPYAFVFRSSPFLSENLNIEYLDSAGTVVSYGSACVATWLNSTAWPYETASSWSSEQNTNSAYVSAAVKSSLLSFSLLTSESVPQKKDLVFPRGTYVPVAEESVFLDTE